MLYARASLSFHLLLVREVIEIKSIADAACFANSFLYSEMRIDRFTVSPISFVTILNLNLVRKILEGG